MEITVKSHGLTSLSEINGKTLTVLRTTSFNSASGTKTYYVVEFEGIEYEVDEELCTTVNTMEAAKFYIQYQGQKGTEKQCLKLVKQLGSEAVIRMAEERGFRTV